MRHLEVPLNTSMRVNRQPASWLRSVHELTESDKRTCSSPASSGDPAQYPPGASRHGTDTWCVGESTRTDTLPQCSAPRWHPYGAPLAPLGAVHHWPDRPRRGKACSRRHSPSRLPCERVQAMAPRLTNASHGVGERRDGAIVGDSRRSDGISADLKRAGTPLREDATHVRASLGP